MVMINTKAPGLSDYATIAGVEPDAGFPVASDAQTRYLS
jgi:hypothetical protein